MFTFYAVVVVVVVPGYLYQVALSIVRDKEKLTRAVVVVFYSDNPSSKPAEAYSFFCNIVFENNEHKQKEAGVGPLF